MLVCGGKRTFAPFALTATLDEIHGATLQRLYRSILLDRYVPVRYRVTAFKY